MPDHGGAGGARGAGQGRGVGSTAPARCPLVIVLCNCPPAESRSLAQALVREGLAACVNIVSNVTSVFQWQGVLHEDDEHTLWIKAPADRVDVLRERIVALHSYTVPEILVLPVDVHLSHPDYVAWVRGVRPLEEAP